MFHLLLTAGQRAPTNPSLSLLARRNCTHNVFRPQQHAPETRNTTIHLVETMTGSHTTFPLYPSRNAPTTDTTASVPIIPSFTAAGERSDCSASIVARIISTEAYSTWVTAWLFCAACASRLRVAPPRQDESAGRDVKKFVKQPSLFGRKKGEVCLSQETTNLYVCLCWTPLEQQV